MQPVVLNKEPISDQDVAPIVRARVEGIDSIFRDPDKAAKAQSEIIFTGETRRYGEGVGSSVSGRLQLVEIGKAAPIALVDTEVEAAGLARRCVQRDDRKQWSKFQEDGLAFFSSQYGDRKLLAGGSAHEGKMELEPAGYFFSACASDEVAGLQALSRGG